MWGAQDRLNIRVIELDELFSENKRVSTALSTAMQIIEELDRKLASVELAHNGKPPNL